VNVSDHPLLPEQPSTTDQIRRFGPPALIAIASVLFIVQNTDTVSFNFLWFEFSWPLWIMLIVFMLTGAIVAYGVARRIRSRRASRSD
jgi:uncharacterized integral membrane protein